MQLTSILPATCELCGNWLPAHSPACPRNGVHPSQWTLDEDIEHDECLSDNEEEQDLLSAF